MADESIGNIRRQATQGLQSNVSKRTLNRQTTDTAVRGQIEDNSANAERLVRGIGTFGTAADEYFTRKNEEKIALDKVTQQQRAIAGLAPTDDATTEGLQAYQVVKVRDDVLEVNNDIAESIRTNPEMTDDEFEQMTREKYAPLLGKYKGNVAMGGALSNRMQESQVQLTAIRRKVQSDHRAFQNQNQWVESIDTYREAAQNPAELLAAMEEGGSLYNEGLALGVSAEAQRTVLVRQAALDASNGDGRLVRALKGAEWADNDPRIEKAEEEFQKWDAQENAVAIGTQWGKIQDAWKNRRSSWAQTTSAIEKLNERFPGTVSASAVASLRQSQKTVKAGQTAATNALMYSLKSMNDPNAMALGLRDDVSDKVKRDSAGEFTKLINAKYDKYIQSGELDESQARELRLKDKLQWSERHRIVLPEIKTSLKGISASPIEPNQELSAGVRTSLETIGLMNTGMRDMYLTEKEQEFYNNYQLFASEEGTASAGSRAWNATYRAGDLSPDDKRVLRERAAAAAKDVGTGFFNGLPFVDQQDVPDWQQREITQQLELEAKSRVTSGGLDIEAISEQATERFKNTHTQLPSGTFVKGDSKQLARALSYKDEKGRGVNFNPENIGDAFMEYWEDNKDILRLESADEELDASDVKYELGQSGQTFIVRDKYGNVLSNVEYTEDLGRMYNDRRVNKAATTAREAQERRDATAGESTSYRPY